MSPLFRSILRRCGVCNGIVLPKRTAIPRIVMFRHRPISVPHFCDAECHETIVKNTPR